MGRQAYNGQKFGQLTFNRHLNRQIDRETLIDILALIEYEQARLDLLELDLGYAIGSDSVLSLLFEYVLDVLHWPVSEVFRDQAYAMYFTEPPIARTTISERLSQLQKCRHLS